MGLGATVLFIPRAVLTGFVPLRHQRHTARARQAATAVGTDRWGPFLLLAAVEFTRSVNFFGTSTFIELYWIAHLHASRPVAGVALTCFLIGGVAGTSWAVGSPTGSSLPGRSWWATPQPSPP
jgi:FSR family fosmidomycin resistance protein-like MFS transporter